MRAPWRQVDGYRFSRMGLWLFTLAFLPVWSAAQAPSAPSAPSAPQQFAVGTCEPNLQSYATISQAVAAVPYGATVLVCPGNYPEQVTIGNSLTLKGVQIGGTNSAVITVPATGLVMNVTDLFGNSIAAQLLVKFQALVNISNIAVDGSNNELAASGCPLLVGIYYQDSSGTLDHVATRNQVASPGCDLGIRAEATFTASVVTIENSSIHNFDGEGINANADPAAQFLTVNIKSNIVGGGTVGPSSSGIVANAASGTIQSNDISATLFGINLYFSAMTVTSNTFATNSQTGGDAMFIDGGSNTIKSNKIDASGQTGLFLVDQATNVIQSNTIANSSTAIDGCGVSPAPAGNTVSSNTIMDAVTGISLPSGNVTGPNTYDNVAGLVVPCGAAAKPHQYRLVNGGVTRVSGR